MLELVGVPYVEGGVDPAQGLDCFGVIRWVLNNELGMAVPDQPPSAAAWPRYVKVFRLPSLPKIQKYDILMFSDLIPGLVNHLGIMCSEADFIHASSFCGGTVCEPLYRHEHNVIALGRPLL